MIPNHKLETGTVILFAILLYHYTQEALLKACITNDWTTANNLLQERDERMLNDLLHAEDEVK